jgi:hypothetical protein
MIGYLILTSLLFTPVETFTEMKGLLPDSILSYQPVNEGSYTGEDLFDYINGGAELFNSYGFNKLITRTYHAEGQPDIITDIFDMGNSYDAFGVFSYSMHKTESDYGQGSQSSKGMIVFWQDRYYVSIIAYPETPGSKKAVDELAQYISKKIGREGNLPEILNFLPNEGLNKESIKYFHHYIWLNSLYFISHENILDISDDTPAVLAKYGDSMAKTILLLIHYPDEMRGKQALDNFLLHYIPDHKDSSPLKIEDGTYINFRITNELLAIVFNAGSPEECQILLDKVNELYKNTGL